MDIGTETPGYAVNINVQPAVTFDTFSTGPANIPKSMPVLTYHRVVTEPDGFNTTVDNFVDQMFALKKAGYQTLRIAELYTLLQEGREIPGNSVLITFDDGRTDGYYPVDPILRALDFSAVMYVITGQSLLSSDERSVAYLSRRELKKMANSGRWDIQSHGMRGHDFIQIDSKGRKGHYFGDKQWVGIENRIETDGEFSLRVLEDLIGSKEALEREIGTQVLSFSYPFGDYGQSSANFPEAEAVLREAVESVYQVSFNQGFGGESRIEPSKTVADAFFVKRIQVHPDLTADDLLALIAQAPVAHEQGSPTLVQPPVPVP